MLRAAVAGAGRIGSRLDAEGASAPITHAGALAAHGLFELCALADTDVDLVRSEAARRGVRAYADVADMLRAERLDVLAVCTPTLAHAQVVEAALEHGVRAIVAEKPLTSSLAASQEVVRRCADAGVPLVVHYTRRFIPAYAQLRARILQGGAVAATIRYAKGLRHNGVHAADLARYLFGEVLGFSALDARYDHWADDPTVTACLRCERCDAVLLQGLDERCYTHFDCDVFLPDGRVVFGRDDFSVRGYEVQDSPRYHCPCLRPGEERPTGKEGALQSLYDNVAAVLAGRAEPVCSGTDALAAETLCQALAVEMGRA
ncbi:Gfo/Idh/MocA family protein [Desulfocurvus sp. DL9XJH121]